MTRAFLGGSFDPVHNGHIAMADQVLRAGLAQHVHVVPAWRSPFKDASPVSATDRLAMTRLAFANRSRVSVDDDEVAAGRTCYTVETLAALRTLHGADDWVLLVGGDNLAGLTRWREADKLQQMATIVVLGRSDQDLSEAALLQAGLSPGRVRTIPEFSVPVSSTALRELLADRMRSLEHLVQGGLPEPVARYILEHGLYLPEPDGVNLVSDPD